MDRSLFLKLWARWFYWQHHGNDLQPPSFFVNKSHKSSAMFGNLIFAESSFFCQKLSVHIPFFLFCLNEKPSFHCYWLKRELNSAACTNYENESHKNEISVLSSQRLKSCPKNIHMQLENGNEKSPEPSK